MRIAFRSTAEHGRLARHHPTGGIAWRECGRTPVAAIGIEMHVQQREQDGGSGAQLRAERVKTDRCSRENPEFIPSPLLWEAYPTSFGGDTVT